MFTTRALKYYFRPEGQGAPTGTWTRSSLLIGESKDEVSKAEAKEEDERERCRFAKKCCCNRLETEDMVMIAVLLISHSLEPLRQSEGGPHHVRWLNQK